MARTLYDLDTLQTARITRFRNILAAELKARVPEADLDSGFLHDLVLELYALLVAASEQEIDSVRTYGSLQALTENPALADTQTVDAICSNYRVTRRAATRAKGQVSIVLSSAVPVVIAKGSLFTSGTLSFRATDTFKARTDNSQVVDSTDRLLTVSGSNRVFVIDVESVNTGAAGNLPAGTVLTPAEPPVRFVQAFSTGSLSGGSDAESNASLITRLLAGAAARVPGTADSFEGMIREKFPTVRDVSVVTAGNSVMLRDRHGLFPVSSGGCTDIRVLSAGMWQTKTVSMTATLYSKVGATGTWQLSIGRDVAPGWYEIEKVLLPSQLTSEVGFTPTVDTRSFDISGSNNPDITSALEATYSRYQTATVRFVDSTTNATSISVGATANYQVLFRVLPDLAAIQSVFTAKATRSVGTDVLVLAPTPIFTTLAVTLLLPTAAPEPDQTVIKNAIAAAVVDQGFGVLLSASLVGNAVLSVLPQARVHSTTFAGRLRKADGTNVTLSGTTSLDYVADPATMTSYDTTIFFLPASAISVSITRY